GFIGAVLIGQVATEVGIFVPEVLLYAAVAAIGVFVTPSFELGLAIRVMAIFLLVITGFLKLPGFLFGSGMLLLLFVSTRSFGVPYLWPLVPLEFGALKDLLFRKPVPLRLYRPSVLRPGDRTSQPNPEPEPSR
ncbi:MAG: spore germination protein, partial [Firmicutes bacterium]|nr:spore germination protein [Bacillota bacterium]